MWRRLHWRDQKKRFSTFKINITIPLKSQNQLHTFKITLSIILLGGYYVKRHQMLEHVRIFRRSL